MSRPKAYSPEQGYRYQILCRNQQYNGLEWEHLDHAKDRNDRDYLLGEYKLAYRGTGFEFKVIELPQKYWKESK